MPRHVVLPALPAPPAVNGRACAFAGIRVMIPRAGCLAGSHRNGVLARVVTNLGGELVTDVAHATHLVLDQRVHAEDAVPALSEMREWPRIHTDEWVPQCSVAKAILPTRCVHHSQEKEPRHTQTTPSSAKTSQSPFGSYDRPPHKPSPSPLLLLNQHASAQAAAHASELEPRRLTLGSHAAVHGHEGGGGSSSGLGAAVTSVGRSTDSADEEGEQSCNVTDDEADEDSSAMGPVVAMEQGLTMLQLICQILGGLAKTYKRGGNGGAGNSTNWGRNQHWAHALGTVQSGLVEPITAAQLRALKGRHGISEKTVAKLLEIYRTGRLARYDALNTPHQKALNELQSVWGIGTATAEELVAKGVTSREVLLSRVDLHAQLRPGTLHYLRVYDEVKQPIPSNEIAAFTERVREIAFATMQPPPLEVMAAGSYRRGKEGATDMDILIFVQNESDVQPRQRPLTLTGRAVSRKEVLLAETQDDEEEDSSEGVRGSGSYKLDQLNGLLATLRAEGLITDDLTTPKDGSGKSGEFAGNFYMGLGRLDGGLHRRIDMRCFEEHERAAALLHCTGSGIFNRSLQRIALSQGLQLSEKGLCRANKLHGDNVVKAGAYYALGSEADIFEQLGLVYREPYEREDKTDVLAAVDRPEWGWVAGGSAFPKRGEKRSAAALEQLQDAASRMPLPLMAPKEPSPR